MARWESSERTEVGGRTRVSARLKGRGRGRGGGGEGEGRRTDQGERLVLRLGKTRVTRWDRRTDQGDQEGIGSGGTLGISKISITAGWALEDQPGWRSGISEITRGAGWALVSA